MQQKKRKRESSKEELNENKHLNSSMPDYVSIVMDILDLVALILRWYIEWEEMGNVRTPGQPSGLEIMKVCKIWREAWYRALNLSRDTQSAQQLDQRCCFRTVKRSYVTLFPSNWCGYCSKLHHDHFKKENMFCIINFKEHSGRDLHKSVSHIENTRSKNKKKTSPSDDLTAEDLFN